MCSYLSVLYHTMYYGVERPYNKSLLQRCAAGYLAKLRTRSPTDRSTTVSIIMQYTGEHDANGYSYRCIALLSKYKLPTKSLNGLEQVAVYTPRQHRRVKSRPVGCMPTPNAHTHAFSERLRGGNAKLSTSFKTRGMLPA